MSVGDDLYLFQRDESFLNHRVHFGQKGLDLIGLIHNLNDNRKAFRKPQDL